MMIWIIDKMIMKGSCLTVGKWKYLQRVTFSCDWPVWKFRLRGEIKWRSLRSEGVGASCRWDHSSCLESFIYRAMEKPWHSQEPFRLWALVWVGLHRHFHNYQYCRFWWWLTSSFVSSVRSSNSHPDLLLIHHHPTPTFSDHTGPR